MTNLFILLTILVVLLLVIWVRRRSLLGQYTTRVASGLQDPLTGVSNRRRLDELLLKAVANKELKTQPLAVIFVDIDHLDGYNERYGRNSGDEVMIQVAHLLQRSVRSDDVVGRWGDDRFLIIAPNLPPTSARQLAETIRGRIETLKIHGLPGQTATIGGGL
ncbi:MAG: GGDEF domain-containing protein, partial [Gammaproteobacteria bacterium]|nr:GGDEF domain-containing protein [Gammaproteobacteria bacterium]